MGLHVAHRLKYEDLLAKAEYRIAGQGKVSKMRHLDYPESLLTEMRIT